jgi:hypothetical protein
MRVLKGHATAVMPRLELNFPIPAGVSGSPVMVYTTVVGFATGRVRSEEIDEQSEEITTDVGGQKPCTHWKAPPFHGARHQQYLRVVVTTRAVPVRAAMAAIYKQGA